MFSAKLLRMLAVALVCFSGEAEAKHKHHKKEKVPDSVQRSCGEGEATIIVDGISGKYIKDQLRNVPLDITLTYLANHDEIRARHNVKFIKYAHDQGHIFGYRFDPEVDDKFYEMSPKKLAADALEAAEMFKQFHGIELEYIFFPNCSHHLTKHTKAVEEAGFTVVGNNLWIDAAYRKTSKSTVKKQIKKLEDKKKGAIIYMNGHNKMLLEDINVAYGYLRAHHFDIVDLDECVAEESEDDEPAEKPDGEEVIVPSPTKVVIQPGIMAPATQAKPVVCPNQQGAQAAGAGKGKAGDDDDAAPVGAVLSGAAILAASISAVSMLF